MSNGAERTLRGVPDATERALLDALPQLVLLADARGRVVHVNRRWVDYTGVPGVDAAHKGWARALHPDERAECERAWSDAVETGVEFERAWRLLRARDETYRWHLLRVAPRVDPGNGAVRGWLATATDIEDHSGAARESFETEKRALAGSEARLRRLLDDNLIGSVVWHVDGTIAHANEAFLRMFGYTRSDLVTGQVDWRRLTPAEYAAIDRAQVERLIATGTHPPYEKECIRKDGALVPVLISSVSFPDDPNVGFSYLVDLTVVKRAEAAVRRKEFAAERAARAAAEEASRAKDEFLATISHELRTPLTAMLGWAKLLRAGGVPPEKRDRALEALERNASAQAQLIEDLLDISRIVTGKLRLEQQLLELPTVLDAAVDAVRPAMEAKQIELSLTFEPRVGRVRGDVQRLQQVVWNLLANAAKFTPSGGHVALALMRRDEHVEVVVSDDGPGIRADVLPRLFNRFEQGDMSITRSHGGLGLGLALARHLVELHGGTIHAASDGEGHGATFTVRLPAADTRRAEPHDDAEPGVPARPLDAPPELLGLRVLVVDDEPDTRELVATILQGCGAQTITASSASDARAAVYTERPDVVLSDIGMPEEDGYAFMRSLRALPREDGGLTPSAALTAYARAEDRRAALEAGYQMHLAKPVDPAELLAVVANLARIAAALR